MSQIAFSQEALQQTLQNLLQPDEQLLWSDYPHLKQLRIPLTSQKGAWNLLFDALQAFLLAAFLYWMNFVIAHKPVLFWIAIALFLGLFLVFSLRSFLQTFTAALKKAPPYRRYTLYAITTHRALIMIGLPNSKPTVLEYFPDEIDLPANLARLDDSGILPFGSARQAKISRYEPAVLLPGSFLGISHVQEIATLLQQLKSKKRLLVRDSIE